MDSSFDPVPPHREGSGVSGGGAPLDPDVTLISAGSPAPPIVATSMEEIGRALQGHSLGPYVLERFVGGGGMGAVFRALDTTLDRVVAVKVLSRQQSSDVDMLRRFKNEAQLAARLDHENIGRVYAVGSDAGWHYIVFEFIDGTNLRDLVAEEGPLDLARAIRFTAQVAEALEHAWERSVVHRDIKPSNIIITPAGRARLVDMGLARLPTVSGAPDLTASGMTLGTFDYISPEQARDPRAADVRSDLYSLGCTLFYMLTGRPPFADGTVVQKLLQHQQTPPPDVAAERADVPAALAGVVERLLRKLPEDRYQRPADLVADLVSVAEGLGIEFDTDLAPAIPLPLPSDRVRASRWPWVLPVATLLATVALLWMLPQLRWIWRGRNPLPGWAGVDSRPQGLDGRTGSGGTSAVPPQGGGPARNDAEVPTRRTWRVVDGPPSAGGVATISEALARAGEDDIIECAFSGGRDQEPIVVAGRRLTLRAVPGHAPVLRFTLEGEPSGEPAAAITVATGEFVLDGVAVRLVTSPNGPSSMFAVAPGARLDCNGGSLDVRSARRGTAVAANRGIEPICVRCLSHGGKAPEAADRSPGNAEATSRPPEPTRLSFSDVEATGDGTFVLADAVTPVELQWTGGRCVNGGHFLQVEGGPAGASPRPIRLALADALFANREGFAVLLDSPASPVMPGLRVSSTRCRFVTPPGHGFLEQVGIGPPDVYRTAIDWLDTGGRYEGSAIFRRIDGAAEREEITFSVAPGRLQHKAVIEGWEEGGPWEHPSPPPSGRRAVPGS